MVTLSTYLQSLIKTLKSILNAEGPSEQQANAQTSIQQRPLGLQSIEFTIPIAIEESMGIVNGKARPENHEWLRKYTWEQLNQLVSFDRLPVETYKQVQHILETDSQNVGNLLGQNEIAVQQVLFDFSQRVLAVAWDDYEKKLVKPKSTEDNKNFQSDLSFEQLTEQFAGLLFQRFCEVVAQQKQEASPNEIQVTLETQKLREFPSHALTYVKLLITGEATSLQALDCAKS